MRHIEHIVWGSTLCKRRCGRVAACKLDDEPLCLECADIVLDRIIAISINRDAARILPALEHWDA